MAAAIRNSFEDGPAPEYGDTTMLELIAADRHDWLLDSVRRSFDYAATA